MLRDRKCSIGYLPQEINPLKDGTVFENMLQHLGPWTEADIKLKEVMKGLEAGDPKALDEYDDAMEAFISAGGYEMESRAKAILLGLGFSVAQLDVPVATLSGGWAMRLALGGLLAFDHDLLLLDEPTNHLDLFSVKWFEDFLQSYGRDPHHLPDRDFSTGWSRRRSSSSWQVYSYRATTRRSCRKRAPAQVHQASSTASRRSSSR